MIRRTGLFIALATAIALVARPAQAAPSLTVEGYGGWQHLELSTESVGGAIEGSQGGAILGADILLDLGGLGLGVAVDKAVSGEVTPWAGSIMAGFLINLLPVRIELLGELGRRGVDFGDIFSSDGATFVGARPGVSVRLASLPVRLGVTGLVRWPTSGGEFGSPDYGIVGKVGFELP